jgi:tRNA (guanine-N7-)-methyltransferase
MRAVSRSASLSCSSALWSPADFFREQPIEAIFPRRAPLVVDLGCGDGGFLVALAKRHPEWNFLGSERLLGRVEKVVRRIQRAGLANARLVRIESHYLVRWLLPAGSVAAAHVLHPDPWPKRHHHSRRLVQREFMEALHRVLEPRGEVYLKTDDKPYFQWMERVLAETPGFERIEWTEPEDWPRTDFEREFIAKGMPIYRARLRKV